LLIYLPVPVLSVLTIEISELFKRKRLFGWLSLYNGVFLESTKEEKRELQKKGLAEKELEKLEKEGAG